ncbi:MAG: terpene synthase family protein [Spirulinaceae cyanobacterium]
MIKDFNISAFRASFVPFEFEKGLSRELTAIWVFLSSKFRGLDPRQELVKWDIRDPAKQMYPDASEEFIDAVIKFFVHSFELDDLYLESIEGARRDEVCFACLHGLNEFSNLYAAARFPQLASDIQQVVEDVKTKYELDIYICETLQSMFNACLVMFPLLNSVEDRKAYLPNMVESWSFTIEGIRMEQKFIGNDIQIPTEKDYWQNRVFGTVGVLPQLDLCYCVDGTYASKKESRLRLLPLEELVCYQIAIQNDLITIQKDLRNNHNLNWVIIRGRNVNQAKEDYYQIISKVEAWPNDSFEQIVSAIKSVGFGCCKWQASAMRYSRLMQLFCYET